ncbi:hypothetical protein WOLCODRAFT_135145 [Wolfiporia cocos MD-104 SS10]|uniref:C3H1-type domain-containing protein n=1 Tax=Wolfiporia cocos (strain MD-104) TaxID=742152 RepID=A0A2H3IUR7_WOLCO|nr:hypothetical protein WOLCODRAFT_135145 [Wolfiporia cocos MD-104 SS10]
MLFDPETANDLKPWLVRNLEPICDAEPGALADYILALLKHNAPEIELRKELASQLEEFLEKEGPSFIDTLFTALRTKSYLPYSSTSPSAGYPSSSTSIDTGIPIPLDALLSPSTPTPPEQRGRKRSLDMDDRDGHPPAKGSRLNDGQFSRYGRGDNRSSWGGRGERGSRMGISGRADYMDGGMQGMGGGHGASGAMGPSNGRIPSYQPPEQTRGICRDYFHNGYCARGAFCKFSHGDDAVVPSQFFPMNGGPLPFMPMMPNGAMPFGMAGGSNAAYDPRERMDMRPLQGAGMNGPNRPLNPRAPILPRQGDNSPIAQKPGELPVIQDLTPQRQPQDGPSRPTGQDGFGMDPTGGEDVVMDGTSGPPGISADYEMRGLPQPPHHPGRTGYRGGRSAGPRGTFAGDVQSFRPEKRNDKTLVVEKIPEDKLSLGAVNEWFKRFGTVTNVAVDAVNGKALVSFSNHQEAYAAWKSEDAVFSNRFVKVFWHRPMEGHGQVGARMLAASAPLVANMSARDGTPAAQGTTGDANASQPVASTSAALRKSATPSAAAALAAKQRLLEQQIAEQKSLMAQLVTASPQEKKDIMARLRKLGEEMKPSSSAVQSPPPPAPAPAPIQRTRSLTPRSDDKERLERERLDKELELHHATSAAEGEPEESTEELKATLARLKAEAASLGITDGLEAPYASSTTYRPYRGRGRGRGTFRGAMRGGPPRGSMKLDLRPKKLLLKGVSGDAVQSVRDWYETTGQVDSVETSEDGDVIVGFKSRSAAEQGLAKGVNIPTVGRVQISWYNAQQPSAASQKTLPLPLLSMDDKGTVDTHAGSPGGGEPEDSHMQEETHAAGWGGDDEDGFNML